MTSRPQVEPVRRVHIVGMAGSGKTTLARQLAERLHAPCYELDVVGYENGAKRSIEARRVDLSQIVSQPSWVTEGAFIWWIDDLLQHAEVIVWLDLHWSLCYQRIVLRHIKADIARNNRHPGFMKMLSFAKDVRPRYLDPVPCTPSGPNDDGANRAATADILSPYKNKVVHCRRPSDVARFLRQGSQLG